MVASEVHPFAKTGGLADVVGALPRALASRGHSVDVLVPRYRGVEAAERAGRLAVRDGGGAVTAQVVSVTIDRVRILFVDRPEYFDREGIYGVGAEDYPDNALRFAFLARAAMAWTAGQPAYDVVHAHDWQAGLVPVLFAEERRRVAGASIAPTVFTIHNLAYQGVFDADWLPRLGLDHGLWQANGLEYWGRLSFLKGGVMFSQLVTTVSPRYAEEIQAPELGFGFDGMLSSRSVDLVGILNGIDYDQWDPRHDPNLPEPFDASNLTGKTAAKKALLARCGLPVAGEALERPVVGMVSRLVDQKGFDLLAELADELPTLGATFVLLGTGERRYEELWRQLASRHPTRFSASIGFDEGMAHLIEGGADLFLMPSKFEPCGLNQMYSQRYGTIPVVRATGGLVDTVVDVDAVPEGGTGFVFAEYSARALVEALRRALGAFEDRPRWARIQRAGMGQDFSWERSAAQYEDVYARACAGVTN